MYVDITPRGSGKTTRLVDALVDYLNEGDDNTVVLVAPTDASRKHIVSRINEKCGEPCVRRTITSYRMIPKLGKDIRHFVDEYMHIDDSLLEIDESAHYNGTGNFMGEKALEIYDRFVKINGMKPINKLIRHGLK